MKKNNILISILILCLTTSCIWMRYDAYEERVRPYLESIEDNYKPLVVDGVREPESFPDLDENEKTVEGIDQNKDGVRDDIEIFINRNVYTVYEREELKNSYRLFIEMYRKSLKVKSEEELSMIYKKMDYEKSSCESAIDSYPYPEVSNEYTGVNDGIYLYDSSLRENVFGEIETRVLDHLMQWATEFAPKGEQNKYCPKKIHAWLKEGN